MTRYSRVERMLWGDKRFAALSHPQPNAQFLWLYLLTGTHNSSLPGLFVLGAGAMAERLRWPIASTRKCFEEIVSSGMA